MRVKDEQVWSLQLSEFDADELSRLFRDFLVTWMDTADRLIEVSGEVPLREIASKAFQETEQTLGFVSVEWLGQMLLVAVQHWVDGDDLWESLSVWERRMVEQAAALKIAELQQSAAAPVTDTEDSP